MRTSQLASYGNSSSNNNNRRIGLFDRASLPSGAAAPSSVARASSLPASRIGSASNNNYNNYGSNGGAGSNNNNTSYLPRGSVIASRTGSAVRRTTTTTTSVIPPPPVPSTPLVNRPSSTSSNNAFLSHTIGRAADRTRVGISQQYGNSPLQQNNGSSNNNKTVAASPTTSSVCESPSVFFNGNSRASPSRGLFSPLSPEHNNSSTSPVSSTASGLSPTPARSEYSLPSPSAASPLAGQQRSAGLVYSSPFDYSSTSTRYGITTPTRAVSAAASKPQQQQQALLLPGNNHSHHNSSSLLPALRKKAISVVHETEAMLARENNNSNRGGNNNKLPRSPSNDDLGIDLASSNDNSSAGGIVFPSAHHCIVFDLDETLCCNRGPGRAILRPGATELLRELAAHRDHLHRNTGGQRTVEIVLWTASMQDVAQPVVNRLDPDGHIFDHLIYRDHRWFKSEANYTKDLKLLGRDMSGCCIVENSPVSVRLNRQNAILVSDFVGLSYRDSAMYSVRDVLLQWIAGDKFTPIDRHLANHPMMCPRTNSIKAASTVAGGAGVRYF